MGICVKDDRIGTIILDLDSKSLRWTSSSVKVDGIPATSSSSVAESYMDGLLYTQYMLDFNASKDYAAGWASSHNITVGNKTFTGYIASLGEWDVLMEYDDAITSAFKAIGANFIGTATTRTFWTSMQFNASLSWRLSFSKNNGFTGFSSHAKISYAYVRPVYKYE